MVSRNFAKKFLFVTGNVEGIFTWKAKASSHGRPKATEQTKNLNLWNDGKDSPSIRDLAKSQFADFSASKRRQASRRIHITKGKRPVKS